MKGQRCACVGCSDLRAGESIRRADGVFRTRLCVAAPLLLARPEVAGAILRARRQKRVAGLLGLPHDTFEEINAGLLAEVKRLTPGRPVSGRNPAPAGGRILATAAVTRLEALRAAGPLSARDEKLVAEGRLLFRAELRQAQGGGFDAFQRKANQAFRSAANREHWVDLALPVVVCSARHLGFMLEAVVFFTGGEASARKLGRQRWHVQGPGYWLSVGA